MAMRTPRKRLNRDVWSSCCNIPGLMILALFNGMEHYDTDTNVWATVWISNDIHNKVWGEITYQFLNLNGATVEV